MRALSCQQNAKQTHAGIDGSCDFIVIGVMSVNDLVSNPVEYSQGFGVSGALAADQLAAAFTFAAATATPAQKRDDVQDNALFWFEVVDRRFPRAVVQLRKSASISVLDHGVAGLVSDVEHLGI